jgi:hypothetical protein
LTFFSVFGILDFCEDTPLDAVQKQVPYGNPRFSLRTLPFFESGALVQLKLNRHFGDRNICLRLGPANFCKETLLDAAQKQVPYGNPRFSLRTLPFFESGTNAHLKMGLHYRVQLHLFVPGPCEFL